MAYKSRNLWKKQDVDSTESQIRMTPK